MLINLNQFETAGIHLRRAQRVFQSFRDRVLCAQVNDSLARLYLALGDLELANNVSAEAVQVLEEGDEDALLADMLSTQGTILGARCRQREAKAILERAYRIAERCGDLEGAGRALLIIVNEMLDSCDADERKELQFRITNVLAKGPRLVSRKRLEKAALAVAR
jgi:predicted ATPase